MRRLRLIGHNKLHVTPAVIHWPPGHSVTPFDPVTIHWPLGWTNWPLGVDIDHFENHWCRRICILCQQTSPKHWFGNMNITSNCNVTNSAHQIQRTTICHWMKPPHEFFCVRHCMKHINSVVQSSCNPGDIPKSWKYREQSKCHPRMAKEKKH